MKFPLAIRQSNVMGLLSQGVESNMGNIFEVSLILQLF